MKLDNSYLPLTKSLLSEAASLKAMDSKATKSYEHALVKSVFYLLQKQALQPIPVASESPSETASDPLVLKMALFINENYQEDITLDTLCNHFFLSKATICKRFKSVIRC
jgi:YesN/AraC family two-component response regulator